MYDSVFVNVFIYDRHTRKMSNNFIWLLVSFNRHKNIIPSSVHTSFINNMAVKTPSGANIPLCPSKC